MTLSYPDFTMESRPPNRYITDAMWWLWLRLKELEPSSELGGIYANKSGFHNTGEANNANWPGNYSVRDLPNRTGPWWLKYASALDWTFPEAQNGNYSRISKYSSRLLASMKDPNDPRLDQSMYQFFGQTDNDKVVEGYNEYKEQNASSDSSHLWHMHMEIFRNVCGDFWAMWKILTVLMGWTVAQWQASLDGGDTMWCKKKDKGDKVVALQTRIVDCGGHVGPPGQVAPADQPYKWCDGDYGDWTATGLAAQVGGDGYNYGVWEERALNMVYTKKNGGGGEKGDKGDQGDPGKTPTKVTFEIPAQTVTAAVTEVQ